MPAMRGLMCPTDFFGTRKKINMHMDAENRPDPIRAREEWQGTVRDLCDLGVELWFIEPDPVLENMCFPANCVWCRWGKVMLGNFVGEVALARQPEIAHYYAWFMKYRQKLLNVEVVKWPEPFIGYGAQADTVTVGTGGKNHSVILLGYGQGRTQYEAAEIVREIHGLERDQILPIRIVDNYFYDFDTAHWYIPPSPTTPAMFIHYPPAVDAAGRRIIKSLPSFTGLRAENIIELDEQDAKNFFCNGIFVRHESTVTLLANEPSERLRSELQDRGFRLRTKNTPELKKSGASRRCTVAFLPYEHSKE